MKPTIGRIVHICSNLNGCRAAIVTRVNRRPQPTQAATFVDTVDLTVFSPNGQVLFETDVREGPPDENGTWHWPEREEGK